MKQVNKDTAEDGHVRKNINMRRMIMVLLIVIGLKISFGASLSANSMSSLHYDIELQEDGTGRVIETRHMYLTRETEIYIVMENLDGSVVTDFHVKDFGEPLTYQPNWDVDASREEKAGKYGVVTTNRGIELSWGIGEYGEHAYTVSYTVSDMVRQLEDGQAMNWRLFDGKNNINPEEVTIIIRGPQPFTQDNTKIWGFGFEGEVNLEAGHLVARSNVALSNQNHITIIMQFLDQPFQSSLALDQTLSEQKERAKQNSSYNVQSNGDELIVRGAQAVLLLIVCGIILYCIIAIKRHQAIKKADPLITGKQRRALNKGKYYRDIPYKHGSITDVAYLLQALDIGSFEDYFTAFMLKWFKEKRVVETTAISVLTKKEVSAIKIDLNHAQPITKSVEKKFWDIIVSAAGTEGILEANKLKNWAITHYKKIDVLKRSLSSRSKKQLLQQFYIEEREIKYMKVLSTKVMKGTEKGEALFNQLVQFENYLNDDVLLQEIGKNDVLLWEDVLVWASLYGMSETVIEQLRGFCPQYVDQIQVVYMHMAVINAFSRSFAKGYQKGLSSTTSAVAGSGGITSIGGGAGSLGGGGGGAR
ncbi:DUF2207 domain-containing protein [Amphibacillus jilinensis]|uniref:DUF2207 domain-containing protein n=1 Tax=Amphibacillus jilinensis TaxID=1216008 RepID=UPI00036A79B1|nr:DUF2207 domain-containing protein [Amphibacillus jilinensis]